jgi:hypothetical protein
MILLVLCVVSGFRREVDNNCTLLGHYAASGGNTLPTFRDELSVSSLGFLTLEDGTGRLSRNVGRVLPVLAA